MWSSYLKTLKAVVSILGKKYKNAKYNWNDGELIKFFSLPVSSDLISIPSQNSEVSMGVQERGAPRESL